MNLKKIKSQDINAYLSETRGLEQDYISEIVRSRNAWKITAIGACAIATVAVGSITVLLPLKSVETVVLRVSDTTGTIDVIPTVREKEVELSELQHKQLIKQYVEMRHSYDWGSIQGYIDRLRLMSSGSAWDTYDAQFVGKNALHERLRDEKRIETRVISITLLPRSGERYNAMVQFSTQQKDTNSGTVDPPQYQTATIAYEVNPALLAGESEEIRLQNPIGFSVYGYNAVIQYEDKNVARIAQ